MVKILYISNLCSENVFKYVFETSIRKPEQADQKFHGLLIKGLSNLDDQCKVRTLSSVPVIPSNHKRKLWFIKSEKVKNVVFSYIPFFNLPILRNLGLFFYTFFYVIFWSLFKMGKKKMIVCDALYLSIASASLLASKLTFTKNVTIVMDVHGLMITNKREDNKTISSIYHKVVSWMLVRFSGYILLTEQMNQKVNPKKRPYIIMEGLVDLEMNRTINDLNAKSNESIILYAGGLYQKYGVKMLVDAFNRLTIPEARLHLYGSGEMATDLPMYAKDNPKIIYKGVVPNHVVVQDQLRATLLVNPRPTKEEFTKYSFPSKNMEYMVSGTPMLTTKLPGMPKEYWEYVYLLEEETVEGMETALHQILSKTKEELHQFGSISKDFVIKNKNNQKQAERVLAFYSSL